MGIEPKQFYYSTPQEVQSSLILIITSLFQNNEFSVEELIKKEVIQISKTQLEIHLEVLIRKNILIKQNLKYKLNKNYCRQRFQEMAKNVVNSHLFSQEILS